MFTIKDIHAAHQKVKSGADFPEYIKEIKTLGVISFETWVIDSHTTYFGNNGFSISSEPQYDNLHIQETYNEDLFIAQLKSHQQGQTDYETFCQDCARSGVEKWMMDLENFTCTYFDKAGNDVWAERVPQS